MKSGERFPNDQAFVSLHEEFLESLMVLTEPQRVDVLAEIVNLCNNPAGNHTLSNQGGQRLAGWNTVDVLHREFRIVFSSRVETGPAGPVGVLDVLVIGPRRASAVYDAAAALRKSGRLTDDEAMGLWQALALLDVVAEDVGLDGWDFLPDPAPSGMQRTAVKAGVLDEESAAVLSKDELEAAIESGWGADGNPDKESALLAAMRRARAGVASIDLGRFLTGRRKPRCPAITTRTKQPCIRRDGHAGPHRAK